MSDEPRPPYVRFEDRPVEDRAASIESGHIVYRSVLFAIITPPGSRDQVEKEAEVWLKDITKAAKEGRFPETWVMHFERQFNAFKEGLELPETGTPIRTWPAINRATAENILAANIRTVEDLADASEPALQAIGIGAQSLKQRAKAFLQTVEKNGKPAEKLAALEAELSSLKNAVLDKDKRISDLESQVELLSKENA